MEEPPLMYEPLTNESYHQGLRRMVYNSMNKDFSSFKGMPKNIGKSSNKNIVSYIEDVAKYDAENKRPMDSFILSKIDDTKNPFNKEYTKKYVDTYTVKRESVGGKRKRTLRKIKRRKLRGSGALFSSQKPTYPQEEDPKNVDGGRRRRKTRRHTKKSRKYRK